MVGPYRGEGTGRRCVWGVGITGGGFSLVEADPRWSPFTALRYKELGLLISAREVGLSISLRLTDSVKTEDKLLLLRW